MYTHNHDNHDHECPNCGTVWSHSENSLNNKELHSCPKCGREEFRVHSYRDRDAERDFLRAKGYDKTLIELLAPEATKACQHDRVVSGKQDPANFSHGLPFDLIDMQAMDELRQVLAKRFEGDESGMRRGLATLLALVAKAVDKVSHGDIAIAQKVSDTLVRTFAAQLASIIANDGKLPQ